MGLEVRVNLYTGRQESTSISYHGREGVNTFTSSQNREFSRQNNRIARGCAREFLRFGQCYRPSIRIKRRGKSSSLHSKKNLLLGRCGFIVSDIISGGLLGYLGPFYLALGANR